MSLSSLTFSATAEPTPENSDCHSELKAKPTTRLIKIILNWLVFLLIIILHDDVAESGESAGYFTQNLCCL